MFENDELPFIRAILADPESVEPRVDYADWLAEREDVRTASVRLGIELKAVERRMFDELSDSDVERLRRELRNLNLDYSARARGQLPQFDGLTWRKFEGGVIEQLLVTDPGAFERNAREVLDVQPIHHFEFSGDEGQFRQLLASPELARLGALYLGRNYDGPAPAAALANSPHVANLRRLDLGFTCIGDDGATFLSGAGHLRCRELALERNDLTDAAVVQLCNAQHFQELEQLDLGWNEIGPAALQALASSELQLKHLNLHSNERLNAESLAELVQSGRLAKLEWLNLGHCELPAAAGTALFSDPPAWLVRLNLIGNKSNQAMLKAMGNCRLEKLRELRFELSGKVNEETSSTFAAASWLPQVEVLRIRDRGGLHSIGAGLAETSLDQLQELALSCGGKALTAGPLDAMIGRLADNASLGRLRRLSLQVPLTAAAVTPLCKMMSLATLTLPDQLAEQEERLSTALPNCELEFVALD